MNNEQNDCIRGIIDRLQKTGFIVIARGGCFLLCVPRQIAQRNVLVFSAMPERETVCLAAKQQRGFFRVQYNQKERCGTA